MKHFGGRVFAVTLLLLAVFLSPPVAAQTVSETIEARRARLEAELTEEERAIAQNLQLLQVKQKESATFRGEIEVLKNKIAQAQNRIRAKRLEIENLGDEIGRREIKIDELAVRVAKSQQSLSEILRQWRDLDSSSLTEIALANSNWSDFFGAVNDFDLVQRAMNNSLLAMRDLTQELDDEKAALEEKRDKEIDAKQAIEYEQRITEKRETERQALLKVTKNQEKVYQQIIEERRRRAGQIRSALFALRDTAAIPFGQALEYATVAFAQTGVRPAFLLAILKQESNLGENVGTCNLPGDSPSKKWQRIMKPSRDHAAYLRLTAALGLDPNAMPLSCPWQGGWGGAMGPAQFIPSTWELIKEKVAALLGRSEPNPWNPEDAFMASAAYLAELGAKNQGYSAERNAACRYYSGRGCDKKKPANAFYGDAVTRLAQEIQLNMIDPLQNP